jgi:hypothetical protein
MYVQFLASSTSEYEIFEIVLLEMYLIVILK